MENVDVKTEKMSYSNKGNIPHLSDKNKTGFKTAARQVQEYALRSFFSSDD